MKSSMKDFILPAVVLTVICLIVSTALAFTQQTTDPIIKAAAIERAQAARKELLPEADSFTEVKLAELPAGVIDIYAADNGAGYVVTTSSKGYGGQIKVMTGIKSDATISAVKIMEASETPGLGSRVGEQSYLDTYTGQGSDLSGVSFIGGATISSKGLKAAVNLAFDAYNLASGGEANSNVGLTAEIIRQYYPGVEVEEIEAGGVKGYVCGDRGYIVPGSAEGYSGPMSVAVLFDENDVILAAVATELNETPGIGAEVTDPSFTSQFAGKKEVSAIDNIAGATTSAESFKKAVKRAIEKLPEFKGATIK